MAIETRLIGVDKDEIDVGLSVIVIERGIDTPKSELGEEVSVLT